MARNNLEKVLNSEKITQEDLADASAISARTVNKSGAKNGPRHLQLRNNFV